MGREREAAYRASRAEHARIRTQLEPLKVKITDRFLALDVGSSHEYECKCPLCREWWILVGPEEGENGVFNFGPFSHEEIFGNGKDDGDIEGSKGEGVGI